MDPVVKAIPSRLKIKILNTLTSVSFPACIENTEPCADVLGTTSFKAAMRIIILQPDINHSL